MKLKVNKFFSFLVLFSITMVLCSNTPKPVFENQVYCYIKSKGIKYPEIVLRQAIYESGHFGSHIYKTKHNLFGFRKTKKYISYKNWKACVDFYKEWQDKVYNNSNEDYYRFLQRINYSGIKGLDYSLELKKVKIRATLICN